MKMTSTHWHTLCALMLAGLLGAGCASQPAATSASFTLPDEGVTQSKYDAQKPVDVVVGDVIVADYLAQQGIVIQQSEIELTTAQQNLWAESLSAMLTQRLQHTLVGSLAEANVLSASSFPQKTIELNVKVDKFQGMYDGTALVSGSFELSKEDKLFFQERFTQKSKLSEDGYPALVIALGNAWKEVSVSIAKAINTAAVPTTP